MPEPALGRFDIIDRTVTRSNAIVERLRPIAADVIQHDGDEFRWWQVRFAAATDADYAFELQVYDDSQANIAARRRGAEDGESFWYWPFEWQDFDTQQALDARSFDDLRLVLTNRTQIVQVRGCINMSFYCYVEDDGQWRQLYGYGAPRFSNFRFPEMRGPIRRYRSPPAFGERSWPFAR